MEFPQNTKWYDLLKEEFHKTYYQDLLKKISTDKFQTISVVSPPSDINDVYFGLISSTKYSYNGLFLGHGGISFM